MTPRDDTKKTRSSTAKKTAGEKSMEKRVKHPSDLAAEIEEAWRFAHAKPSIETLRRRPH